MAIMKIMSALAFLFIFTIYGFHELMLYSGSPGKSSTILGAWPSSSKLSRPKHDHIVMFIHPGCSCSKASVSELSRLMSKASDLTVQVVVMKSAKLEKLFDKNPLIEAVKKIPRTKIIYDQDGIEANLFHAETSGLTNLYNKKAELVFTGGLTMARGHEGGSEGKDAILSYLQGQQAKKSSLVFGCNIFNELKTLSMVK
jgi:hypothetical protein